MIWLYIGMAVNYAVEFVLGHLIYGFFLSLRANARKYTYGPAYCQLYFTIRSLTAFYDVSLLIIRCLRSAFGPKMPRPLNYIFFSSSARILTGQLNFDQNWLRLAYIHFHWSWKPLKSINLPIRIQRKRLKSSL